MAEEYLDLNEDFGENSGTSGFLAGAALILMGAVGGTLIGRYVFPKATDTEEVETTENGKNDLGKETFTRDEIKAIIAEMMVKKDEAITEKEASASTDDKPKNTSQC